MKLATIISVLFLFAQFIFAQDTILIKINRLNEDRKKLEADIQNINERLSSVKNDIKYQEGLRIFFLSATRNEKKGFYAILKTNGTIRDEGDPQTAVISYVSSGDTVKLEGYQNRYWQVKWKEFSGYLADVYLNETDTVIAIKNHFIKKNEEQIRKENELKEQKNLEYRKNIFTKYGKIDGEKILNGYYWIGMTDEMTEISIGKPININRNVGTWGVHEQWIYESHLYLYFENGILKSYQNSK